MFRAGKHNPELEVGLLGLFFHIKHGINVTYTLYVRETIEYSYKLSLMAAFSIAMCPFVCSLEKDTFHFMQPELVD